jgi:hypothetical protein
MSQAQREIPLLFADGRKGTAACTGNNAAWLCCCARALPLVGFSDVAESMDSGTSVVCPTCSRVFRVIASKRQGRAERVEELK